MTQRGIDHIAESDRKVSISCAHENDVIFRKAAIEAINGMIDRFERLLADIRESKVDDSVCGMCEYDGAYIGQSGDWCNECPGFDKDDCFKLSDECRKRWMGDIALPSAQRGFCEYCNEDVDGFVTPMEKNGHAFIRFGMNGWELSLRAKGWHGSAKIRYCPMCGRDLYVK